MCRRLGELVKCAVKLWMKMLVEIEKVVNCDAEVAMTLIFLGLRRHQSISPRSARKHTFLCCTKRTPVSPLAQTGESSHQSDQEGAAGDRGAVG